MAKLDADQAKEMRRLGFPISEISRRLNQSERHIRRSVAGIKVLSDMSVLMNTSFERDLWAFYYGRHQSYEKVAWMFGVSRQAIWEGLKNTNKRGVYVV